MLSTNFEVLTPLRNIHRVSRLIANVATFESKPGTWVEKTLTGVVPITTAPAAAGKVYELCMSSAEKQDDTNAIANYEANDTKLGRVTTICEPGVRVLVGAGLITGTITAGAKVAIDASGKWVIATGTGKVYVGVVTDKQGDLTEIRLAEPTFA